MRLKWIRLKNIRSYLDAMVEFPLGITLFEGDIGSGKTTLLMAIEFALFGLGSEKGDSLLRKGAREGSVTLAFEVGNKSYEIQRTLVRRGKSVQQGNWYLKENGKKDVTLSVRELKKKVLDILNFNEPVSPRAKSVIYRYTTYTPQEEMTRILFTNSDERLNTIRKAFGIERYKIAADNAKELKRDIEKLQDTLNDLCLDLPRLEKELEQTKREKELAQKEAEKFAKKRELLEKEISRLKSEMDQIQKRLNEITEQLGYITGLENELEKQKSEFLSLQKVAKELKVELKKQEEKLKELASKTESDRSRIASIESEIRSIKEKIMQIDDTLNTVEPALVEEKIEKIEQELEQLQSWYHLKSAKITDYRTIVKRGICPTCDRKADPSRFKQKIIELESQLAEKREQIEKYKTMRDNLKELKSALERQLSMLENAKNTLESDLKVYESQKDMYAQNNKILEEKEKRIGFLREEIKRKEEEIKKAGELQKERKTLEEQLQKLKGDIDSKDSAIIECERKISAAKARLDEYGKQIQKLQKEIARKRRMKELAGILGEYINWLDSYFIPTVELIEKHVLLSLNMDFNSLFQEWFARLVDDPGKEVRVDEDFTPIVSQDGYDQDVENLSGGEKASVAFAYRLALNKLACERSNIESRVLILDEPTYGFSREQINKVMDILRELDVPQIILVSHERELEGCADTIFRVEKGAEGSTIKKVGQNLE